MFSVVVTAEHELEQSVPAVPVFTLGMSLSPWRSGMKGHRAGNAFCKSTPYSPQLETDQVLQEVRSGLLRRIGGEERPSPSPLLSSTPIPSTD